MSEGFVRLVDTTKVPGDVAIVQAAKQSYGRSSRYESYITENEKKIIEFMMEHKHGTPFERTVLVFHVRCTIREAREWFRHRWGSFNEYSTRFSKLIEDWYMPAGPAIRSGKSANGGQPTPIEDPVIRSSILWEFSDAYTDSNRHYHKLLELGAAQELASYVYTLGNMTEFTWTVNVRALCNFLALRTDGPALLELRRKAFKVYELAEPVAPYTFEMWAKYRQPDMVTDWSEYDPLIPAELLED